MEGKLWSPLSDYTRLWMPKRRQFINDDILDGALLFWSFFGDHKQSRCIAIPFQIILCKLFLDITSTLSRNFNGCASDSLLEGLNEIYTWVSSVYKWDFKPFALAIEPNVLV